MSFGDIFEDEAREGAINAAPYYRGTKPRPNMSRIVLDTDSSVRYVELGKLESLAYNPTRERYIAALNLTYDAIMTVYNVDSRELGVCRFYRFDDNAKRQLDGFLRGLHRPVKLEARLMGFQTGQEVDSIRDISEFIRSRKLPLAEVDLFGTNVRHVSMDSMLGIGFEVLLENRVYRPGELKTPITLDQFERSIKG